MKKKLTIIAGLVLTALSLQSCVTVQPWEREELSKPIMMMDKNPIQKGIEVHHLEYREGSAGATGAQSGGCGCG